MKNYLFLCSILFICCFACQQIIKPRIPPERVIKKYQEFIDKNNFDGAKILSTNAGKSFINDLADAIPADLMDSTVIHTQFLNIDCTIEENIAHCLCELEDEYETYEALYTLVNIKGRWLVDAPEEEENLDFEEIEEIVEDILEMGVTN